VPRRARWAEPACGLAGAGVVPAVLDVFDAQAVTVAVGAAKPAVVIHQLTDLPRKFDPARVVASYAKNARIRTEGTRNLIAAAQAAGARRFIVQSWIAATQHAGKRQSPCKTASGALR